MKLYNDYLELLNIPRKLRTYEEWARLEDLYEELLYWGFTDIENYKYA